MTASDPDGVAAALRKGGLRVTAPRLAVLPAVKHMTAEQVAIAARARVGTISTQAVYETRVGDNHHHVVCRSCGVIAGVECVIGEPPCVTPPAAGGFVVDEAEVTFWGLCPDCQTIPKQREK